MPSPQELRFGANYTPPHHWAHAWLNLDPDRVRRDFDGLAQLGLDHVRLLPLWPILQPNRTLIREEAIADVRMVVDLAAEMGLDASVDVIQGHLSSFDYLPAWLQTWHRTNMFTDPRAVEAQAQLVDALGRAVADAPNFLGLTLGNEVNQFSDDPHPEAMRASTDDVTRWLQTLLDAARAAAPNQQHLHAEYDAVFYLDEHPFRPQHAARMGDLTAIHSWIFNGTAQRYGGMSTASTHHAEYLIELARAFAVDPDRGTWLQEVGAPSNCLSSDEMPDFLEQTVRNAVSCRNLWGVTWWCSHDVSRQLADFPDLEYSLGLLDSTGAPKPIGLRFAEIIRDLRQSAPAVANRSVAVQIDVDGEGTPVSRSALGPGGSVFESWVELTEQGQAAALVLSTDDPLTRGITQVIRQDNIGPIDGYQAINTIV